MGRHCPKLHAQETEGRGRPSSPPRGRARGPDRGEDGWERRRETDDRRGEGGACFFCWKDIEYKINCLLTPSLSGSGRVVDRAI